MRDICRWLTAICIALLSAAPAVTEPFPTVILVQNSGWMEPFYTDARSTFRAEVGKLCAVAAQGSREIIVASFNQDGQAPGRSSPELLYRGAYDADAIGKAINAIDLPRKPSGAFVDSDFSQALKRSISEFLGGRPGIIWMVTNNQNAPGNTPDWEERTREFFRLLLNSAGIARVYAHPVRGPASGSIFGRREGYIIYALAYGNAAARQLDTLIGSEATRGAFGAPAVRLKPLDRETIRFEVSTSSCNLDRDGRSDWIQVRVDGGRARECLLEGRLRNRLYPQTIEEARVRVTLAPWKGQPGLERAVILIDRDRLANVPAGGLSDPVRIRVRFPPLRREGWFDRETRAAGVLRVSLEDVRYGWDRQFVERLSAVPLSGEIGAAAANALVNRQLPEIFLEATRLTSSQSDLPIQVVATHSRWPLLLLPALALIALFVLARWVSGRKLPKPRDVTVDLGGELHKISIREGDCLILRNSRGDRFEVRGQRKAPPLVRQVGS